MVGFPKYCINAEYQLICITVYRIWGCSMKGNIVVSGRGQITLPASMRRRLGIKAGGVLVVEDRKGELVLRPAAVVELDTYTDEEIARWEREDRLAPGERSRILKKLGRKR
jgi:antitoxin PrlF